MPARGSKYRRRHGARFCPPPVMGQQIHRTVKSISGNEDPYQGVKAHFTRYALQAVPGNAGKPSSNQLPPLRPPSGSPLPRMPSTSVRLPMWSSLTASLFIRRALSEKLHGDAAATAETPRGRRERILYLGDNAGEIVFDRLLIEQLPMEKVVFCVRGAPVINDATMEDAKAAGIAALVETMDNGSDAPGTILAECSDHFRRRFDAADLVISKGQGNYESLSDADKKIFFILKVKCEVIARHIGCAPGSLVVRNSASERCPFSGRIELVETACLMGYIDLFIRVEHIKIFINFVGMQPQDLRQVIQGTGASRDGFEDGRLHIFTVGYLLFSSVAFAMIATLSSCQDWIIRPSSSHEAGRISGTGPGLSRVFS